MIGSASVHQSNCLVVLILVHAGHQVQINEPLQLTIHPITFASNLAKATEFSSHEVDDLLNYYEKKHDSIDGANKRQSIYLN